MFNICTAESVNIAPVLPEKRPMKDSGNQTEQFHNESKSFQAPERKSIQIQTDSERKTVSSVEFDPDALLEFLNRVTPAICDYLDSNANSHVFDRYQLLSDVDTTSTELTHCLLSSFTEKQVSGADLSWNCTGAGLAVAYSYKYHKDWCDHDSAVAIWNLNRKDFTPQKPNITIECDCCITNLAFHPDLPSLLAGGKFNGEILLWDIAKEDDMLMASLGTSSDAHREPVTGIYWSSEDKHKLYSCSLDGKILVWQYQEKKSVLKLVDGFVVLAENLSRSLGIKSVRPDAEVGITSMTINSEDPSIFIISTEGGGIFQCSFNSQIAVPHIIGTSVPLKSPIVLTFEKHNGHVSSVQFSPFSRNVFLSASTDGEIRIYTLLQVKPLLTIQLPAAISYARWSTTRPLVIAAVTADRFLHLFDLSVDQANPLESHMLTNEKCKASTVLFNKEDPQLLGSTSEDGNCQIWTLGSIFTTAGSYEVEELKSISTIHE